MKNNKNKNKIAYQIIGYIALFFILSAMLVLTFKAGQITMGAKITEEIVKLEVKDYLNSIKTPRLDPYCSTHCDEICEVNGRTTPTS